MGIVKDRGGRKYRHKKCADELKKSGRKADLRQKVKLCSLCSQRLNAGERKVCSSCQSD